MLGYRNTKAKKNQKKKNLRPEKFLLYINKINFTQQIWMKENAVH